MNRLNKLKLYFLLLISLSGIIISSTSLLQVSNATILSLCSGSIGTSGMSEKTQNIVVNWANLPNAGARKYNLVELFGSGASSYSIPMGIHKDHSLLLRDNSKWMKEKLSGLDSEAEKKLEEHGNTLACLGFGINPGIANIAKSISNLIASFLAGLIGAFYNTEFICNPDNPTGNCINLVKIIGGEKGKGGGLLGSFSNGLFMPLASVAFLGVGLWLMWEGLIQRKFRSSIAGVLWALFAFVLGIFVMVKPYMVAKIPQKINTAISGCILDAISGKSCMDGGISGKYEANQDISCLSESGQATTISEKMQLSLGGLSCVVTKGFVIDRWAEEQFGYSFNELYTQNQPDGYEPYTKIHGSPGDYCVNMYSASSPKTLINESNPSFTGTAKVCNVAVAYMANRTVGDFGNKATMADIVITATKDDRMWTAFSGSQREWLVAFTIIGVIFAAVSFVPVLLYGHAYSLTSSLILMFAPIFILIGIHPGRGRKIFLGWLESLISAFLKFMASGMLVFVMILLYSAALSSLSGMMSFVASVILCFTFMSYRKELVNLIGEVNMGGSKVSNKLAERLEKGADKAKHVGSALAGGAIGGAVAGAMEGDGKLDTLKQSMAGAAKGMTQGLGMEMRKGRGMVANAFRQGGQVRNKMQAEAKEHEKEVLAEANRQKAAAQLEQAAARTANIQRAQENQRNKNNTVDKIDDSIENSTIPGVIKSLENAREDVQSAKGTANINSKIDLAKQVTREANIIQSAYDKTNENGSETIDNYLDRFKAQAELNLDDKIEEIKSSKDFNALSEEEQKVTLDRFKASEMENINNMAKNLESQFKLNQDTNKIEDVNLNNLTELKNNFAKTQENAQNNYQRILNERIEELNREKEQSTQNTQHTTNTDYSGSDYKQETQTTNMPNDYKQNYDFGPNREEKTSRDNQQTQNNLPPLEDVNATINNVTHNHYNEHKTVINQELKDSDTLPNGLPKL